MRLAKGWKDSLDGSAQLASRVPGAGAVNSIADAVGGFLNRNVFNTPIMNRLMGVPENTRADFAGEVLGIRGATPEQLQKDSAEAEAEYQAARRATAPRTTSDLVTGKQGDPGVDWMRIGGNVTSPVNLTIARFAPVPKVGDSLKLLAAKGAAAGAAGAATQPVQSEDFWTQKALQTSLGAMSGGVATPLMSKLGSAVGRVYDRYARQPGPTDVTPQAMREQIRSSLAADGVDAKSIPDGVLEKLANDARTALARGQKLDPASALRAQDFEALGLPYTRGQVGRDPGQWTKEFNLSGIEDAGKPLRNVLQAQSQGISNRMRDASSNAQDRFQAGDTLIKQLQGANSTAENNVRAAYDAFRASTGKDMQVPMQGMAQDYARTIEDFGDAIPGAVRKQFEGLGLLGGTQRKLLSVDDAERLIKTINKNYDPSNRASAKALDELRGSVQKAITSAADSDAVGAEAAQLAAEARQVAKGRFDTINNTPALKAAINNVEPDDFVRKYVIGGKVNEIQRMQDLLGQEGRDQVRAQTIAYLRNKAFGANAAGDGKVAQATFNEELNRIGRPKLEALLGPEGADDMQRIGRVLAYIKQAPEGATPNTSGTSQALVSLLGKLRGVGNLPLVNDFVVKPVQAFSDRRAVSQALQGATTSPADLDPATVRALTLLLGPGAVSTGALSGAAVR